MSPSTLVWWLTLGGFVVVVVMAGMRLMRAAREAKRLQHRIDAFAALPVVAAVRKGERDVGRVEASAQAISPLIARAAVALATIKRGPVPPELVAAIRRVRAELAAFRSFARR
ncbi:MAG: hypothetical protein NVS3B7_15840 [Candidatus Elarobacter sp.]